MRVVVTELGCLGQLAAGRQVAVERPFVHELGYDAVHEEVRW